MKKRILSLFLAVVMLALAVPAMALSVTAAEEAEGSTAPSVSTTFSLESNFPVYKNEDNTGIAGAFDFKGGWQFGSLPLNTINPASIEAVSYGTTLTPYTGAYKLVSNGNYYYSNKNSGWNESSASSKLGGAIIIMQGKLLMAPGVYMGSGSAAFPHAVASNGASATIRYTAQYTGDVTINIKGDWWYEYTQGYAHIFVLKNGSKIADIVQGEDAVDATITTTLTAGQTLDFVAVMDPTYTATNDDGKGAFRHEAANRTFIVDAISVNYSNLDSEAALTSKFNSSASTTEVKTITNYAYTSEQVRFFQWYDANGNPLSSGATLSTGCYAMLNPEMVTAAGIDLEKHTYAEAFDLFVQLLIKANTLSISNPDWTIGFRSSLNNKYEEIKYPVIYGQRNLGLVSSSGTLENPAPSTSWEYAAANAAVFTTKTVFDGIIGGLKTGFAAYVTDDTVKAGTVKVAYDSSMTSVKTTGWTDYRSAIISMGRAFQGHTRSGSSYGYIAYRYTAPRAGTATFVINDIDRYTGTHVSWNLAVNNALEYATSGNDFIFADTSFTTDYKNTVAGKSYQVAAGDTIDFLYATASVSSGGSNGFRPTITATTTYDCLAQSVEGQLTMAADYAINVYAKPNSEGGVVSAIVDGKPVAGVKQENGSYKMPIAEGIVLTDLTTTEVAYQLQEIANGHVVIGAPRTMSAVELLEKYAADSNTLVANLAKDLHYLAIATNYLRDNSNPQPTEAQYAHMVRNQATLLALPTAATYTGEEGAYKIVGANVNLGNRLSLVLLVNANAGAGLMDLKNGYELYAYNEGVTLSATATEFAGVTVGGQEYMGIIVDIPVAAYGETLNFVVRDALTKEEVSSTLQYGMNTWCAKVEQKIAGYSSQRYIARGVYNLGQSAAAYQASL